MTRTLLATALLSAATLALEANPPQWDTTHVKVIEAGSDCQTLADAIFAEMGGGCDNGQWSESRYALLFKSGFHNCSVNVGYYTQILGLGRDPTLTEIREIASPDTCGYALDNFWRGVENIHTGYHGTV
jgi:hypothetical protein